MKASGKPKAIRKKKSLAAAMRDNWQLYILVLPAIIYFVVFNYLPLYGIQIAFKDYKAVDGIAGSAWVGLKHFKNFFNAYYFKRLLSNTLLLNVYYLLWSFPVPLILAIFLNQIRGKKKKRFIQTSIYVPYFISTVVLAGMLYIFLSPTSGILNFARTAMGLKAIDFMSEASAFRPIYIISGIWQAAGYGTILYIATLTGIDPSLYEAAEIDGASFWQKLVRITVPMLKRTVISVGVLVITGSLKVFEIVQQLTNGGPAHSSETLVTYSYSLTFGSREYGYGMTLATLTFLISFVIMMFYLYLTRDKESGGMV